MSFGNNLPLLVFDHLIKVNQIEDRFWVSDDMRHFGTSKKLDYLQQIHTLLTTSTSTVSTYLRWGHGPYSVPRLCLKSNAQCRVAKETDA